MCTKKYLFLSVITLVSLAQAMEHSDTTLAHPVLENGLTEQQLPDSSENGLVYVRDRGGDTPLHIATSLCNTRVAQMLLSYAASVNVQNEAGDTPLHRAIFCEDTELVHLLLSHNASIDIFNSDYDTALDQASLFGHEDNLAMLLKNEQLVYQELLVKPLLYASARGDDKIVKELLRAGADPTLNFYVFYNEFAAQQGGLNEILVQPPRALTEELKKENISRFLMFTGRLTALHLAAYYNRRNVVHALLKANVDLDEGDGFGYTPLWYASLNGHNELVKDLTDAGSKIPVAIGTPALICRVLKRGHFKTAEYLLNSVGASDAKDLLIYGCEKDVESLNADLYREQLLRSPYTLALTTILLMVLIRSLS